MSSSFKRGNETNSVYLRRFYRLKEDKNIMKTSLKKFKDHINVRYR